MRLSLTNIKNNFRFKVQELLSMAVSILISSFILSFRKWGAASPDIRFGLYNLALTVLILSLNMFISISVIKILGLKIGHKIKYSFGKFSTLFSVFIVFLTNGLLPFFAPGTFSSRISERYRFGKLPPGLNMSDLAKLSIYASFSSLCLALFCKILMLNRIFANDYVINRVLVVSAIFAIVAMLPFPEFNGFYVFFSSRLLYIFAHTLITALGLMFIFLSNILLSLILAPTISAIAWIIFYTSYEKKLS